MGIDDPWIAWCFDEAVQLWANYVIGEARQAGKTIKNEKHRERAIIERVKSLLREPVPEGEEEKPLPKGMFRDPASLMKGG